MTVEEKTDIYVNNQLEKLNVKFGIQREMSEYLKESLMNGSKTKEKTSNGIPDFSIEGYDIPVIIEDKRDTKHLISENKNGIKLDDKSISNYAVNGALFYAQTMIRSGKYEQVAIIGVAGTGDDIQMQVYYVFDANSQPKLMSNYTNLNFLETEKTFNNFLKDAKLTEAEKHQILIKTRTDLSKQAKTLNKLMNNMNITADNRVVYVSGALLAMQKIIEKSTNKYLGAGLTPDDLIGSSLKNQSDGELIVNQIQNYLIARDIPDNKVQIMMNSFRLIKDDPDHNVPIEPDKLIGKMIKQKASVNKQIFTFIYHNIFQSIDATKGVLDIMGEMYSEFLKYALGDGKGIGIVLTPPYITKLMADIEKIDMNSKVMDLATGSAGFLIAAMDKMVNDANQKLAKNSTECENKIKNIKSEQLLGVELNQKMFTLAATNMILRGDGSTHIYKGDSFKPTTPNLYADFKPDRLLLNPPFKAEEKGMPLLEYGMRFMKPGGIAAIIIQDSAGSGKAEKTNKKILEHNTMLYSIKMPTDLFEPSAGVQTSIYVFQTGIPHDFDKTVRFIDFRNDGYKRTSRGLNEIDNPVERYQDIIKIVKAGKNAKLDHPELWNLDDQVFDDQINDSGVDWNFEKHQIIDTTPTEADFMKTVGDYLSWQVDQVLKGDDIND